MKTLSKELTDYLDQYIFVNRQEVEMAVVDFLEENNERYWVDAILDSYAAAESYISEKWLLFDADLVITLDNENNIIHLTDLSWELNDEQVQKIENKWNLVFAIAVDCIDHKLPKEHYENLASKHWLDINAIERLRSAADQFLYPDYTIEW